CTEEMHLFGKSYDKKQTKPHPKVRMGLNHAPNGIRGHDLDNAFLRRKAQVFRRFFRESDI
ncbi:MAG: hypothetical protein JXA21_15485, partial [Anaerolineae bacterium]|nr:hypothetical protein [Anaerolineae bacterium]